MVSLFRIRVDVDESVRNIPVDEMHELCRVDLAVVKKDPREHDHKRDHTHNGKKDDILSLALQHALQRQKDIQTAFGILQRKMVFLKAVGF